MNMSTYIKKHWKKLLALAVIVAFASALYLFKDKVLALLKKKNDSDESTNPLPTGNIVVTATDTSDPWLRDWSISKTATGPSIASANCMSGQSATFNITAAGTYFLRIGQSGGSSLGTYSGTIVGGAVTLEFSGLDVSNAFQFEVV